LVFRKIDQEEGFIGWERFLLSPPRPIARLEVPKFFKNGGCDFSCIRFGFCYSLSMKTKLNGIEIETTAAKIAAVRHFCVFAGNPYFSKPIHQVRDDNGTLRCEHCGQMPHETSFIAIARLLK
jgi:hypothetical protein